MPGDVGPCIASRCGLGAYSPDCDLCWIHYLHHVICGRALIGSNDQHPIRNRLGGYLPIDPLWAEFERIARQHPHDWYVPKGEHCGMRVVAERVGVTDRTLWRWRKQGRIERYAIDRACCRLGLHPMNIYGNAWIAESDGASMTPVG